MDGANRRTIRSGRPTGIRRRMRTRIRRSDNRPLIIVARHVAMCSLLRRGALAQEASVMTDAKAFGDFIVGLFGVLFSWPVALLIVVYWLREPLGSFLRNLRRLRAGGIEADIGPQPSTETAAEVPSPTRPDDAHKE